MVLTSISPGLVWFILIILAMIQPLAPLCIDQDNQSSSQQQLQLPPEYNFNQADLEKFNNWIEQTLAWSEENSRAALLVDKAAYRIYLVVNGQVHSSYPVELGHNPIDDKTREGDSCTPEGIYRITWKRDIGHTVFHRAFLINYPNSDDRREFQRLLENGEIPSGSSIGSHIEVHGSGSGKPGNDGGYNWTLGCVALSSDDIDRIFPYLENGDRITIVRYGFDHDNQ
jgi:murein L,D-transpeptidase YafK